MMLAQWLRASSVPKVLGPGRPGGLKGAKEPGDFTATAKQTAPQRRESGLPFWTLSGGGSDDLVGQRERKA